MTINNKLDLLWRSLMSDKKVNIGIIGLGFGKEFIPIYQQHPNGGKIAICTRREDHLKEVGDQFNIDDSYDIPIMKR